MRMPFFFLMAMWGVLSASSLPEYTISAVEKNLVILTNDAFFEVRSEDLFSISSWQEGDSLKLFSFNDNVLSASVDSVGKHLIFSPLVCLCNTTRNNSQALAFFKVSLDISAHVIVAIDDDRGVFTLSDGSQWVSSLHDRSKILLWQPGDMVMIGGHENSLLTASDAFLLNVFTSKTINVMEDVSSIKQ